MKLFPLFQGNLVLDCPVSPRFLNSLPNKQNPEFTYVRYTAATCDPADFKRERYTLRQVLYEWPRPTELLIIITLADEDEITLSRTLHGVMKNIAHLCSRQDSKIWGSETWRSVVVAVIADGRTKYYPMKAQLMIEFILGPLLCWPDWVLIKMALQRHQ
jgi:chitin synthase